MGSIVIGSPKFGSLHLHERVHRELTRRGHRVTLLFDSPTTARFWQLQGLSSQALMQRPADAMRAPLEEFAAIDARLRGMREGSRAQRRYAQRRRAHFAQLLPDCVRRLETLRPDLLLLPHRRDGLQRMLHFVARELGVRVRWLGDGLLPHTLQRDDSGLDGEAAITRRVAVDYRDTTADAGLLNACLTHLLGRAEPAALSRREVHEPPRAWRLRNGLQRLRGSDRDDWRSALQPQPPQQDVNWQLPPAPFATVLLQDERDPRILIDACHAPDAAQLVAAARTAVDAIDPHAHLAVVAPALGLHHRRAAAIAALRRVQLLPATAAAEAAAMGFATFTINHPLAIGALLAGTPTLHCGRALFGLAGITHRGPCASFANVLGGAIGGGADTLRQRFLTVLLGQDHLWCSPSHPDHNGLSGLANAIEGDLAKRSPQGARIDYRTGPPWPLAT